MTRRENCLHVHVRIVETRRRKSDGVVKRHRICLACGASWWDQPRLREPVRGRAVVHVRVQAVTSGAA